MNNLDKLKLYIEENLEIAMYEEALLSRCMKCRSIDSFLDTELNNDKFTKLLFEHIDKKQLKDSDIYNKANIDRRLFSKIRSNENYHPKKETVIALGLAIELNINEFEEFLKSASYFLPKNNLFDVIIRFCVLEHIYDILEVNILLSEYNCQLLTNN